LNISRTVSQGLFSIKYLEMEMVRLAGAQYPNRFLPAAMLITGVGSDTLCW
jgi:hypothetical protein